MTKDLIFSKSNRFIWFLLASQAGFINVAGFLTVHRFVSHITGFSSHVGIAMTDENFIEILYGILVPVSFLVGSFFSAIFTAIRRREDRPPMYFYVMFIIAFIYFIIALLGHLQIFGSFGESFSTKRDFVLAGLLAFSCGAQNALFTHYSHSVIRTTHLTGITTDLGIGMAKQWLLGDEEEKKVNKIRRDIIFSFLLGSMLGAYVFESKSFLGFLIPSLLSFIVGMRLLHGHFIKFIFTLPKNRAS